nr:retinol dehydrogenase 12-like [Parasteatoda tepidariorum]
MIYLISIVLISLLFLKLYLKVSAGVCRNRNSMEGKVVIITGANSGIGFETALEMAARKAKVILACRNLELGQAAANEIIARSCNTDVYVRRIDLSSLDSVKEFAAEIHATEKRLDVLIHNAGTTPKSGLHLTKDNLEEQFATNHFGPFLLNHLLLDLLKMSAPSRIIVVSSVTHWWANLDLDNMNCEKCVRHPYWIYCSTKLANILFVRELSKRLEGTGVTANSLHPGGVRTKIARNAQWYIKYIIIPVIYFFLKDSKSGAQTSIYLATSEEVKNISGQYFVDCKPAWTSPKAKDDLKAKELWKKCEILTKIM